MDDIFFVFIFFENFTSVRCVISVAEQKLEEDFAKLPF
jgi:hypothetical protein